MQVHTLEKLIGQIYHNISSIVNFKNGLLDFLLRRMEHYCRLGVPLDGLYITLGCAQEKRTRYICQIRFL